MELLSLVIVLLYLNLFMGVEFEMPINVDLENIYAVTVSLGLIIASFFTSYISNIFMFNEGIKISKKHSLDISFNNL